MNGNWDGFQLSKKEICFSFGEKLPSHNGKKMNGTSGEYVKLRAIIFITKPYWRRDEKSKQTIYSAFSSFPLRAILHKENDAFFSFQKKWESKQLSELLF